MQVNIGFQQTCTQFTLARVCETSLSKCPVGYELLTLTNRCYRYTKEPASWADAQATCEGDVAGGAKLASIHSREEALLLKAFVADRDPSTPVFWIGLNSSNDEYDAHGWTDDTPDTYHARYGDGNDKEKSAECGTGQDSSTGRWMKYDADEDTPIDGSGIACKALPFVCKTTPTGVANPCECSGQSDGDSYGGSCKRWTPDQMPWDVAWCYVSDACLKGVHQSAKGLAKVHCIDPNVPPPPPPPKCDEPDVDVTAEMRCEKGNFYDAVAKKCTACSTTEVCSAGGDGKTDSSENHGDFCGSSEGGDFCYNRDYACCVPYADKQVGWLWCKTRFQHTSAHLCVPPHTSAHDLVLPCAWAILPLR